MRSPSDAVQAPFLFLMGCAMFYFGVRGFQKRGITFWFRSGGTQHIRGLAGRIVGTVLILLACVFLGLSVRIARLP